MYPAQLLNFLIDRYQYESYLEIGVGDGVNFQNIHISDKTGVDPDGQSLGLAMCSDGFFAVNRRKYDLVFIDGFHTADQAYKDFENAFNCLNSGGCIVLHDCLPREEVEQGPPRDSGAWTGDVWKALVRIRQLPYVNCFTLDSDWGFGIIFAHPNTQILSDVPTLNWETYITSRDYLMRVVRPEQFLQALPYPPNRKNIRLTTVTGCGRIGHQFQDIVSGMIMAELFGVDYFYSGWSHNEQLNYYLNFADFFDKLQHHKDPDLHIVHFGDRWAGRINDVLTGANLEFLRQYFHGLPHDVVVTIRNSLFYSMHFLLTMEEQGFVPLGISKEIIEKFRNIVPQTRLFSEINADFTESAALDVAVYIRGGGTARDMEDYFNNPIPKADYDRVINKIREDHPDRELNVVYYTQGPLSDLVGDFSHEKVVICDEQYPRLYEILKTLIVADVFVGAASAFSTMVSIFRSGPTYYTKHNYFALNGIDIIV